MNLDHPTPARIGLVVLLKRMPEKWIKKNWANSNRLIFTVDFSVRIFCTTIYFLTPIDYRILRITQLFFHPSAELLYFLFYFNQNQI